MRRLALTFAMLCLVLTGCAAQTSGSGQKAGLSASRAAAAEADSSGKLADTTKPLPAGFNALGSTGIAFKWTTKEGNLDCPSYAEICWRMEVYSEIGCPNGLSVKVALEDDSGTIVDWKEGTLSSLKPGGKGEITLTSTSSIGGTAHLKDGSCF